MKLNAPVDTAAHASTLAATLAASFSTSFNTERRKHVMRVLAGALWLSACAPGAQATAVFNRQTGQPCAACHTAPPELTPLGRRFKLGGYTMRGGERGVPLSAFVQAGYTATSRAAATPAPGLDANHNLEVQKVKLLAGGALGDSVGAFAELVWNPIAGGARWGNLDMRYADSRNIGEHGEHDLLYGVTLNNNPGFQDPWNSTPVRSWPYTRSAAAPQPRNVPLLDGPLAQRSLGLGLYGFIDDEFYVELAGYGGLDRSQQEALGVDPGEFRTLHGLARYARVAHERKLGGGHSLTLGASAFVSELSHPGARLPGTDAVRILGADLLYQWAQGPHEATLRAAAGNERWDTSNSVAQGLASNDRNRLDNVKASVSYLFQKNYSASIGTFRRTGSTDRLFFATPSGRPDTAGHQIEAFIINPFFPPPAWHRGMRMRLGLNFTHYTRYDGARDNVDGSGRSASDNDTVFLYLLWAF